MFKKKLCAAFCAFGPAFLVSVRFARILSTPDHKQVAYLDPGNWATAIEGGSRFGYQLV